MPTKAPEGPERKSYVGKKWIGLQDGWMWPLDSFYTSQRVTNRHFGLDMNTDTNCGTSVYAASDGVVIEALTSGYNNGYGKTVLIDHGSNRYTRYAHLQSITVFGGPVARHQEIGHVGNTGYSYGGNDGCHLHFEAFSL